MEQICKIHNINQYKHLILRVGYDQSIHGYLNPCQTILDEKWKNIRKKDINLYRFILLNHMIIMHINVKYYYKKIVKGYYVMKTLEGDI